MDGPSDRFATDGDDPGALFTPADPTATRPFDENRDLLPPRALIPGLRMLGHRERRLVFWATFVAAWASMAVITLLLQSALASLGGGRSHGDPFVAALMAPVICVLMPFTWPFWMVPAAVVGIVVWLVQAAGVRGPTPR